VRPTHHSETRTVPKWCVGRTLPVSLNLMALRLPPVRFPTFNLVQCQPPPAKASMPLS